MKVIWTGKAKISFSKILEYLNENWTQREIDNFADETSNLSNSTKSLYVHSIQKE